VEWPVARLPAHHRIVFPPRELQGKTYEEIPATTGQNLGTVTSRRNRARNNFAQIIEHKLR
jgi:DNA-directed RNA polymerase specialized sigma24 family protein